MSASALSFEVFRFAAFFALEKGHDLLRFFFEELEDISSTNKAITRDRLIGRRKAKHAALLSRDF